MSPYWMLVGWLIGAATGFAVGLNAQSRRRYLVVTTPAVVESVHAVSSSTVRIEFADGSAFDLDVSKRSSETP